MTTFNGRLNVKNGDLTVLDNTNRPRIQLTTTGTVNVKDSLGVANAVSLSNNGIDMLNRKIVNVGNPTNDLDGVNKRYVDNNLSDLAASVGVGLRVREPVRLRTTDVQAAAILGGGHSFTGTGATKLITKTAPFVALSIDGTTPAVNDRILFDGTNSSHHYGIYNVNSVGSGIAAYVLQRIDIDLDVNNYILVNEGATLANSSYILTEYGGTVDSPTLGLQTWTKFSNAGGGGGGTGVVESVTIGTVTGIPTGDGFWINGTVVDPVINLDLTKATSIGTNNGLGALTLGNTLVSDVTESTTVSTGALVVNGGIGVAKNLVVGGEIRSDGAGTDVDLVLDPKGAGKVVVNGILASGGVGTDVDLVIVPKGVGKVVVPDIVVSGSIIGSTNLDNKELIIQATTTPANNGMVHIKTISESTLITEGALVVDGGVSIAKNLNVGGSVNIATADISDEIINIMTGADTVAGASFNLATGVNFKGQVNIATGISALTPNPFENEVNIGTGNNGSYTKINMGGGVNSFSSISINTNPNSGTTQIGRLVEPTNVLDASNKKYNDKTNLVKVPVKYRTTNLQGIRIMDINNDNGVVYNDTTLTGPPGLDLDAYFGDTGLGNPALIDGQDPQVGDRVLVIVTDNSPSSNSNRQGIYVITSIGDPWVFTKVDLANNIYNNSDSLLGINVYCINGTDFGNKTYMIDDINSTLSTTIHFKEINASGGGAVDTTLSRDIGTALPNGSMQIGNTAGLETLYINVGLTPNTNTIGIASEDGSQAIVDIGSDSSQRIDIKSKRNDLIEGTVNIMSDLNGTASYGDNIINMLSNLKGEPDNNIVNILSDFNSNTGTSSGNIVNIAKEALGTTVNIGTKATDNKTAVNIGTGATNNETAINIGEIGTGANNDIEINSTTVQINNQSVMPSSVQIGNSTGNCAFNLFANSLNIKDGVGAGRSYIAYNSGELTINRLSDSLSINGAMSRKYNDRTNLLKKPAKYRTTNSQAAAFMDEIETVYVKETSGDFDTYIEGINPIETLQDFLVRMTGSPTIDGQTPSQDDIFLLINTSGTSYKQGLYKITVIGDTFNPWRITRTDSINDLYYTEEGQLYGLTFYCINGTEFANTSYVISNVNASLYPSGTIQFTQISSNIEYVNIINDFPFDLNLQKQTYITNYFQSGIELNIASPTSNIVKKITLSGDSKSVIIKTSTDRFFLTAEEPYLELAFTAGATKWKKISTSSYPTSNDSNIVVHIPNGPEITSFRSSIAISKDKTTLAVGYRDYNGGEGAVFIYTMIDNIWRQQSGAIVGTGFINVGNQGASVALSADGNTLAVGGPTHDNDIGAVWIFTRTGTTWTQQSLLGDPGLSNQRQGTSVALSGNGDVLAIGGPSSGGDIGVTLIYRRSVGVWTLDTNIIGTTATNDSSQGTSVALSDNGNTLAIGGPTDDGGQGRIWVYFYNGVAWVSQAILFDPLSSGTNPPRQGTSVALSDSGDVLAVGAPRDGGTNPSNAVGSTRVYRRTLGVWNITPDILIGTGAVGPQQQGTSVSLSGDGNVLAVGAPANGTGATHIFTYNVTWSQQTRLVEEGGGNGSDQGRTLALSSNGDMVVMQGIDGLGTVFNLVFSRGGNSWRQRGKSFTTTNSIGYTKIGSIAISENGQYLAVGLPEINNLNGGVLIYIKSNAGWALQTASPLIGSNITGPVAARQGTSVALSADGSTLAFGGPGDNDTRGAVWIFNRTGTNWVEEATKIAPPGTDINNTTCAYISLSSTGDILAIGSEDTNMSWIYTRATGVWTLRTPGGLSGDGLSDIAFSRSTVSLSGDGSILAVGYPGDYFGKGAVVIFTRIGNEWGQYDSKLVSSSVDGDSLFGSSISVSGDGTTIAVGAPGDKLGLGAVVVYTLENTFWTQKNKKYYYYENYAVGNGVSVKLNNTGNIMVVGATNYQEGQGAALVYTADKEKIFTFKKHLIGKTTDSVSVGQGRYIAISGDASVIVSACPNELFFENRNLWTFV